MAALIVGSTAFDMTTWNLADIANGSVTSDGATEVDVTGAGGYFDYTLTGTDLGSFDGSGFPQSGTITGLIMEHDGKTPMTITGISIDASDFMSFVNGNNPAGLEAAIFSGNDSFYGRAHDDVLYGFAGNDSFNLSVGGNDTVNGGDGDDTINFGAAFTAADTVDGGAGTDKVELNGDYSAGVTFSATTMVNVEGLNLHTGHSYNLTLDAATATSGQSLEIYAAKLTASETLTVDGSATAGNLRLVGGAGNDTLIGGSGADQFFGGNGDNTYIFSVFDSNDAVRGGGGDNNDTLVLNGDFSGGTTFTHEELQLVQTISLTAGHDYNIATDSKLTTTIIDGSALGSSNSLTFDGSANTVADYTIIGGAGNDVLTGSATSTHHNTFDLSHGGEDTATGGGGNDVFDFGGAFDSGDQVNGGGGADTVDLNGTYSSPIVFGANQLASVEILKFEGGSYAVTMNDGNVPGGQVMEIHDDASNFTFDGSAETDGTYSIFLGAGTSNVIGSQGNDIFYLNATSTNEVVHGGGGHDTFQLNISGTGTVTLSSGFQIIGNGDDTLNIDGNAILNASTFTGIGMLGAGGHITMADGNVPAGATLDVTSGGTFDGSRETDGAFNITVASGQAIGGAGDDTITSGGRHDFMTGGGGADLLIGGRAVDTFIYGAVSDSTSTGYDTIGGFNPAQDFFQLWFTVGAVDTQVTSGALSTASFDSDLASAVGASQLGAHHAVVFSPDSGTLAGDHFLVIDANGTPGYQAGQDLVMALQSNVSFTASDFIT